MFSSVCECSIDFHSVPSSSRSRSVTPGNNVLEDGTSNSLNVLYLPTNCQNQTREDMEVVKRTKVVRKEIYDLTLLKYD